MSGSSQMSLHIRDALRRAVAAALDRKRRLGQYAVVLKDGQIVRIEPDEPDADTDAESKT